MFTALRSTTNPQVVTNTRGLYIVNGNKVFLCRPTFKEMHISGPKSDYNWRLLSHDRAMRGGIDDVGIGALFGLYDYRYEVGGQWGSG